LTVEFIFFDYVFLYKKSPYRKTPRITIRAMLVGPPLLEKRLFSIDLDEWRTA